MKKIEKSIELAGRELTLSTGHVAEQASGAVIAQYGETVVLATVVGATSTKELDYFPLGVEYMEKLYAGGRIKGSRWVKRDGRPTDEEILTARVIDRSIRPLFPKTYKKEVQVILTVLSVDMENAPDMVAGVAASAAIAMSSIPWKGPIGMMRVGMKDEKYLADPTNEEMSDSQMDLIVSSTKDAIVMVEAGSNQVTEQQMQGAIEFAHTENQKLIKFLESFVKEAGKEKEEYEEPKDNKEVQKKVEKIAGKGMKDLIKKLATKEGLYAEIAAQVKALSDSEEFTEEEKPFVAKYFDELFKRELRAMALSGKRPDGRKTTEIRKLSAEIGFLPRTHGSGLFQRGQTQALSIATLGSPSNSLLLESSQGEHEKRYIHQYNMPPFSTGEAGRVGAPGRREIGHGALGERALLPVLPNSEEFPYMIQVVSEVLSSNGSTSMASTCGSTLALMDAGVPLKALVGGIAMGLVVDNEKEYAILTDIIGLEDFNGDMDFKVAGTKTGITALQLDVKTLSLTPAILAKALAQAKDAREEILTVLEKAVGTPKTQVSKYAPKIKSTKIDPTKIGEVVGGGGKVIKKIMADTGTQIDIQDDGTVTVTAVDDEAVNQAIATVEGIVRELMPGEIFEGTVMRIQPFGVFVEVLPGKEGMVHVSDMSEEYVSDPGSVVQEGAKVQVRVKEVDKMGRLNLSMVLDPAFDQKKEEMRGNRSGGGGEGGSGGSRGGYDRPQRSFDRGNDRGPRRSFGGGSSDRGGRSFDRPQRSFGGSSDRGGFSGGRGRSDRPEGGRSFDRPRRSEGGPRSSGPHFPASRLMNDDSKKFSR
jgi:polyribonucleotide nucleotidyltransferase